MRKYGIFLSIMLLIISILIGVIVILETRENTTYVPTWKPEAPNYVIYYASVGSVEKTITGTGRAELDQKYAKTYVFANQKTEDCLVKVNDVVQKDAEFFPDDSQLNESLGVINNILVTDSTIEIVVNEFKHLYCSIDVPQANANEVKVDQEVIITYNEDQLKGKVREKGYFIDDNGKLNIQIEILENDIIIPNSIIDIQIILRVKTGVLAIPKEALIFDNGRYYVEILEERVTNRREVQIGIIGNKNVEIISGIYEREVVVLSVYE